jgi:hypothetical protein
MAAWLLILGGAAALVVVTGLVALAWMLSGRARPGGVIAPGVQAAHGQAERTNIQHNSGDLGPGI